MIVFNRKTFVFFLLLHSVTSSSHNSTQSRRRRSEHVLAPWWRLQSVTGVVGTLLNSFTLYMFIIERSNLINTVNAMILYVCQLCIVPSVISLYIKRGCACVRPFVPFWPQKVLFLLNFMHLSPFDQKKGYFFSISHIFCFVKRR